VVSDRAGPGDLPGSIANEARERAAHESAFLPLSFRSIGCTVPGASADSSKRHFGWTFKGPRALRPLTGGDRDPGVLVMCSIPLDLERRFERRWAARFSGAIEEHRHERRRQQLTAHRKSKREARRVELAGSQRPGARCES
jgi:hypothetical protein